MNPPPRDSRRLVPAYLATGGRARPSRNTLDRLTVLHRAADSAADSAAGSDSVSAADSASAADSVSAASAAGSVSAASAAEGPPSNLRPEERRLLDLLRPGALSLAEAAAHLRLPVSVLKVLVADLVDSGHLRTRAPIPDAELPDRQILEKVLDGLRTLKSSR